MLTKRERVIATILRKPLDAIPWQFDLIRATKEKLIHYYGTEDWFDAIDDHLVRVGARMPANGENSDLASQHVRDEFGVIWQRGPRDYRVGNWGELVESPIKTASLKGYSFPDGTLGRWDHVAEVRRQHPDHYLEAGGGGLFQSGWGLCGFENYLAYVAGEQKFIEALTDGLAEFSCRVTAQLAGSEIDGIRFGDDWGFQDGLMIRPELWRRLYKKYYRRIYAAAHDVGLIVAIHSCGDITDILPDLIDIGVQVVHPLQPEAIDVEFCKREYGKDLAFWGALGSQSTLPRGSPEDVKRDVRYLLDLFKGGGYILAPAGAAPAETSAKNIAAVVEVAREQLV